MKETILTLESRLSKHPKSELRFIYEDPATKQGGATCTRKNGREFIYFSKSMCLILDTETGKIIKEQALPKEIIWGTVPSFKISGTYLNKTETVALILNQEKHITKNPYFYLYDLENNTVEFIKFKDKSARLIHNHGFENEIYFTKFNGYKISDTLFDRNNPNRRPRKIVKYPGLNLFSHNITTKEVKFLLNLSNINKNEIAYQFVLDLKFHKKPLIWYFKQRLNRSELKLKCLNVKERKLNFQLNVKEFEETYYGDFQVGCDMMDYRSFCICLEKNFHIYDLEFFESPYLFFDKINRKIEIFKLREENDNLYTHISGIYHESVEEELKLAIKNAKNSQKLFLKRVNDLILLYSKYEQDLLLNSNILNLRPPEEKISDFSPFELIYNITSLGYGFLLRLINVFNNEPIVSSLSGDTLNCTYWYHNGYISFHYLIEGMCFFTSIKINYVTGGPVLWSEAFVNCSLQTYKDIQKFSSEGMSISNQSLIKPELKALSFPNRKYALFWVGNNFVVFQIGNKNMKFKSQYNSVLKEGKLKVYMFEEDNDYFFVAWKKWKDENKKVVLRKLYQFQKPKGNYMTNSKILIEELILEYEDYFGKGCDFDKDLKYFFYKNGNEYIIYYIAKAEKDDPCLIYKYDTSTKILDAKSFNNYFLFSPLDQSYLRGDNHTIFPKRKLKYNEMDDIGGLVKLSVFQLREKEILYYEPLEKLNISNFVYFNSKVYYEIEWAGYRQSKFYLWVSYTNHFILVYSSHSVKNNENEVLRTFDVGMLENNYRERVYFYDEYAFQTASTAAFYCILRGKFIEKNYDSHFEELNKKIEWDSSLDNVDQISKEHPIYEALVKKIQNCLMLINVDSNYVNKKIKIYEIIEDLDDDEVMKSIFLFFSSQ